MSALRPAKCLFCRLSSRPAKAVLPRQFHSSPPRSGRRQPAHKNIKASDMGLVTPDVSRFVPYTEAEKAKLAEQYTPEQLEALEAGEAAIDPEDLARQGAIRQDPMALKYLDDFSKIDPVVDKPVLAPLENYDPNLRLKTEDESDTELARFVENFDQNIPEEQEQLQWMKFIDNYRTTVGDEKAERNARNYFAPELPKIADPNMRLGKESDSDEHPMMLRLYKQAGMDKFDVRKLRSKNLVNHRVVNMTHLGKIASLYYLTVVGDGNGMLGIGEGKSAESDEARIQALRSAILNMKPIPRYEERTIYGEVRGKVGAVEVHLMNRPPGFGLRCQQYIFEMCRAAGIKDIAARVTRSRNPMNVIKASFQALMGQRIPDEIARARGQKLVDVRKVYYGGKV
ncbi:MAG: tRNA(m5U54)methyltransferase [Chaenotheca gracillima]|nr:MAG: tRNA(m5U54)methyltransferase [Chaenotheca gracillima]